MLDVYEKFTKGTGGEQISRLDGDPVQAMASKTLAFCRSCMGLVLDLKQCAQAFVLVQLVAWGAADDLHRGY